MTTPTEYVLQLKAKLAISPIIASFNSIIQLLDLLADDISIGG